MKGLKQLRYCLFWICLIPLLAGCQTKKDFELPEQRVYPPNPELAAKSEWELTEQQQRIIDLHGKVMAGVPALIEGMPLDENFDSQLIHRISDYLASYKEDFLAIKDEPLSWESTEQYDFVRKQLYEQNQEIYLDLFREFLSPLQVYYVNQYDQIRYFKVITQIFDILLKPENQWLVNLFFKEAIGVWIGETLESYEDSQDPAIVQKMEELEYKLQAYNLEVSYE